MANESAISVEQLLLDQATQEMNKPPRTKKIVHLANMVEFLNTTKRGEVLKNYEARYPSVSLGTLRTIVKENASLNGRVWPTSNENFGICFVNVGPEA